MNFRNPYFLVIISGFLIGVFANGLLFLILVLLAFITAFIVSIAAFYEFSRPTNKLTRITGFIFIFFLVSTLSTCAKQNFDETRGEKINDEIIDSLYSFHLKHGKFPNQIDLPADRRYLPDTVQGSFKLIWHRQLWEIRTFNSQDSTWSTDD